MNAFSRGILALWLLAIPGSVALAAGGRGSVRIYPNPDAPAYALIQENNWHSMNMSLDELQRLHRRYPGDLLWFRKAGRAFLVRDRAVLLQVKGAFASLRTLEPESAELQRRERALDRKEKELDREEERLDQLRDSFDDDDDEDAEEVTVTMSDVDRRDLERRQRDLKSRRRTLEPERREVEELERSVDAKEEVLEKKAETELWKLIDQALAEGKAAPAPK